MANHWFKFYGAEYLSDPKMLTLYANDRSCWISLLCYASVCDEKGIVRHLSEEQLMTQAGVKDEDRSKTKGVLERFEALKMIKIEKDYIKILNYKKRQETNLTGYERVKRYRESKKGDNKVITLGDNAMITLEEKRIEERRIEENRREGGEKSPTPAEQARKFFDNQEIQQEETIQLLVKAGVSESVARTQIKKFVSYWTELNKSGTKQRWEREPTFQIDRRLRTWFDRIGSFKTRDEPKGIRI